MKVRNGFVSNSSSSSFVVNVEHPWQPEKEKLITDEQIQELLNYGFKYTWVPTPQHIEWNDHWAEKKGCNLGLSVVCNEHDVMEFLIENDIPFKALTHYGHYSEIWDGVGKIKRIRNIGIAISMYGGYENDIDEPAIEEFTKEEWLKTFSYKITDEDS